jgi:hypothetical protein
MANLMGIKPVIKKKQDQSFYFAKIGVRTRPGSIISIKMS